MLDGIEMDDRFDGEDESLFEGDDPFADGFGDDPFAGDLFDDGFGDDFDDPFDVEEGFDTEGSLFGEFEGEGDWFDDGFSDEFDSFGDWEDEFAGDPMIPSDAEVDEFLGKAFRSIGRFVKKGVAWARKRLPGVFKMLAPLAAKVLGGVVGGPAGSMIASALTSAIVKEAESESEEATLAEALEEEALFESAGGDYRALEYMEIFAEDAATAEDESEADYAIGRMSLMTRQLLRRDRRLRAVYPRIMKAAAALAKTFRGNPQTRGAIRLIPLIVRNTLVELSRHRGAFSPKLVVTVMAKQAARALGSRNRISQGLRRHRRIIQRVPNKNVRRQQSRRRPVRELD